MKLPRVIAAIQALFEAFVLAEILWYYLHDGEQTLHAAAAEFAADLPARLAHRASVDATRRSIRDLPEQE